MSEDVTMQVREIISAWLNGGTLSGITKHPDGHRTYAHDTLQTAALIDIAASLRGIKARLDCHETLSARVHHRDVRVQAETCGSLQAIRAEMKTAPIRRPALPRVRGRGAAGTV